MFHASGRCMPRTAAWRGWKRALRTVGLDQRGRGCHAARHTRVTLLYAARRDLRLVATKVGHADVRTAMIYANSLPKGRGAAAAVDARLHGAAPETATDLRPAATVPRPLRP